MFAKLRLQQNLVHITQALTLQRLSNGMIGVFIPFVILQNGGTLWMVVGFNFLRSVIKLSVNVSVIRAIGRLGAHVGLGISFIFNGLKLIAIFSFVQHPYPVFLAAGALVLALEDAFNDNTRHIFISAVMDNDTKSSNMATMEILGQFGDFLGPAIGAIIASIAGADALLIIAFLVLSLSFVPLQKIGKIALPKMDTHVSYSLHGAPGRDLLANYCFNVDDAVSRLLWPIYLAVVLGSFYAIGSIAALSVLVTIVFVYVAGHRGDRGKNQLVLREGTSAISVINMLRIFARTPLTIALISSAYSASKEYISNALNSIYYGNAQRRDLQYIVAMEIACDSAQTTAWGVLLLAVTLSRSQDSFFVFAFIIAAIAIWGTTLLKEGYKTPLR